VAIFIDRMKIEFADKRLALIRTDRAYEFGLPAGVVKGCQNKIRFIEAAPDERTLRNWKSLEYKKLEGSDERQIKINDQYRMRFTLDTTQVPPLVIVTFIGDPH
jgi:proteic killer suppression protein